MGDDPIKAFVTIILFDRNYNFIDVAYSPAASSGALISASYTVKEPGYAYMYISNEHPYQLDVYFDDVSITDTPSQIVSASDYFPFGLSFRKGESTNGLEQRTMYNSMELQDELSLNWYDYGARMYMPEIGRWGVVDPLAETSRRWSPYRYAFDNPVRYIDPDGMSEGGFQYAKGGYGEDIMVGGGVETNAQTYNSIGQETGNFTVSMNGRNSYLHGATNQELNDHIENESHTDYSQDDGGGKPPVLFIDFLTIPKGIKKGGLMNEVKNRLILNGVTSKVAVKEYSTWGKIAALFSGQVTATATLRNFARGDKIHPSGGFSFLNSNESVVYNGLRQFGRKDIDIPASYYVNAILHELGHSVWGFHDVLFGGCTTCVMDYSGVYNLNANFTWDQISTVENSIWGK